MLQVGNFSAWISVDGVELTQYSVEKKDSEASCWIASEVGKNFSVRWKSGPTSYAIRSSVFVDGRRCDGMVSKASKREKERYVDSAPTSGTSERPLVFSTTKVTDDDEYLETTNPGTGEIKLAIYECEITEKKPFRPSRFTGPQEVHEESKKALEHQVGLGDERNSKWEYKHSVRTKDKKHLASFIFRYRPIGESSYVLMAPPLQHLLLRPQGKDRYQLTTMK
ncbi:hypothetical protein VKT23_002657 [Stygiomarasmius scandens]|uniref:DUF7918 domain-containing protein n=1 Tax=Marasmiellus scandens TaxID=2682957 RepID=A0ABR1K582_9AGAR